MVRMRLRTRILVVSSALAALLTVAMLALVSTQASRYVDGRLIEDLRRGHDLAVRKEVDRLRRLETTARVIGSFPALKALVEQTDEATVRDALVDYRQEHLPQGLLAVLAPGGRMLAWTDGLSGTEIPDVTGRWVTPALQEGVATGTLTLAGRVFHAAAVPVDAAGAVFGFLLAALPIDDAYAQELREAARDEVVILGPTGVLASTILRERLPWRDASAISGASLSSPLPFDVELDGERFTALSVPTAPGTRLAALTLQSRDQALAPYRLIQGGLLVLGLFAIAAGVTGSAMLARSITRPVGRLVEGTKAVAQGNYDFEISVEREDELGELASSFNVMTRGLREREAMAKFVSQSTVEMIQAQERRATPASERRLVTVFFSDIRGFTSIAERLTPEDAVNRLNEVLRAEAEIVARFKGDVDKFIGDAVFAVFAGEDMAVNAIRSAVEVQHAMQRLSVGHADMPIDVGDVAEHSVDGWFPERAALRGAGTIEAQIERHRRRQREDVVEDRVLVRELDGRASGNTKQARLECLLPLREREGAARRTSLAIEWLCVDHGGAAGGSPRRDLHRPADDGLRGRDGCRNRERDGQCGARQGTRSHRETRS